MKNHGKKKKKLLRFVDMEMVAILVVRALAKVHNLNNVSSNEVKVAPVGIADI